MSRYPSFPSPTGPQGPASFSTRNGSELPAILRQILLPDDVATEAVAFRADGADHGRVAQAARGKEPLPDARIDLADLCRFLDRSLPDLLLRVVAKAHRHLMVQVQKVG